MTLEYDGDELEAKKADGPGCLSMTLKCDVHEPKARMTPSCLSVTLSWGGKEYNTTHTRDNMQLPTE